MSRIETINQNPAREARSGHFVGRVLAFLYGVTSYLIFFVTFLYAIGFVSDLVVPKTIDSGAPASFSQALIINLGLMALFAVQHSVMARKEFKRWWTQFVPVSVERTTYVLFASLTLALLLWQWRPIPTVVWQIANPSLATSVTVLSFVGWTVVLTSTFLINHFELFGLQQVQPTSSDKTCPRRDSEPCCTTSSCGTRFILDS